MEKLNHKQCSKCKTIRPLTDFHKRKQTKSGYRNECKICRKESYHEWKIKNQSHLLVYYKQYNKSVFRHSQDLKRHYGITLQDYNETVAKQNGQCLACNSIEKLQIDHDHNTGRIRGLICGSCNRALGQVKDSIQRLEYLIEYLKRYA